jgi:phage FluMu protein Com
MVFRYPVRNFRCPFCGAKMRTEEYKGWKPWKCPGCSAELQFSKAHGAIVQLCFFGVALVFLYLQGFRGWQLGGITVLGGGLLALMLYGPLTKILPPRLELYRQPLPPPWKAEKFTTIFPHESIDSVKSKQTDHSNGDMPRDS